MVASIAVIQPHFVRGAFLCKNVFLVGVAEARSASEQLFLLVLLLLWRAEKVLLLFLLGFFVCEVGDVIEGFGGGLNSWRNTQYISLRHLCHHQLSCHSHSVASSGWVLFLVWRWNLPNSVIWLHCGLFKIKVLNTIQFQTINASICVNLIKFKNKINLKSVFYLHLKWIYYSQIKLNCKN